MIFNPTLPPSANYVEREIDGKRVYERVTPQEESPTEMERLSAQILFTAVMTDTLIEEEVDTDV